MDIHTQAQRAPFWSSWSQDAHAQECLEIAKMLLKTLSLIPKIIDIWISWPVRSAVSTKSPAHLPDRAACLSLHLFIHNAIILSLCLSISVVYLLFHVWGSSLYAESQALALSSDTVFNLCIWSIRIKDKAQGLFGTRHPALCWVSEVVYSVTLMVSH